MNVSDGLDLKRVQYRKKVNWVSSSFPQLSKVTAAQLNKPAPPLLVMANFQVAVIRDELNL